MALSPGVRLGVYEILAKLGEGGMGEVYRARDTRLKRDVAIKVLPELFARDPDRLARFEREAELLATLNHPNVAAIYGFEDAAPVAGIVLELVDGPTLADRIARGAVPVEESLAIARQIADALEAAHDKGIVHRDLKPANVKLTPNGQVKVLDFGLAKAMDSLAAPASVAISISPTMVSPATQAGLILGTAAYMSPEQARGKAVDQRADIWAFGCVLFEMLTGRPPFDTGDTVSDAIAAILTREPAWDTLPASTPASIHRVLRRCLEKEPHRRLHHIADARLELDDANATGAAAVPRPRAARAWWSIALPWALAALAIGVAVFSLVRSASTAPSQPGAVTRLDFNLPADIELYGANRTLTISPDGTTVAFIGVRSGARQVYLRRFDQFEIVPIRGSDAASTCFFSANGKSIGLVTSSGILKTISLADNVVTTLADGVSNVAGVAWTDGGAIVFPRDSTLWTIPQSGGTPKPLTSLVAARHESSHAWPLALPGGKTILFTAVSNDRERIESVDLPTGTRHNVVDGGRLPLYTIAGFLVFIRDGRVLVTGFNPNTLTVTGTPTQLLGDVPMVGAGVPLLDVSLSGTVVYSPTTAISRLVWVNRHGEEQILNDDRRNYVTPRVSPDGQRVLVQAGDLWIEDLSRGTFSRVTNGEMLTNAFPRWLSDSRVIYRSPAGLRTQGTNGPGDSVQLIPGTNELDYPGPIAADGDTMIFLRSTETSSFDILAGSLRGAQTVRPLVKSPAYEGGASLSPDGRWMSYVSNETGRNEVYVMPFPGPGERLQVSTQGGTQAIWNRDGKELFYRIDDRMFAVDMSATPTLKLSQPRLLFERRYSYGAGITIANFDVSRDGQRFIMVKPESGSERLDVVLNWFATRSTDAGAR